MLEDQISAIDMDIWKLVHPTLPPDSTSTRGSGQSR